MVDDEDLLSQVRINLIYNSLKFTPPGGKICLALCRQSGKSSSRLKIRGLVFPRKNRLIFSNVSIKRIRRGLNRMVVTVGGCLSPGKLSKCTRALSALPAYRAPAPPFAFLYRPNPSFHFIKPDITLTVEPPCQIARLFYLPIYSEKYLVFCKASFV